MALDNFTGAGNDSCQLPKYQFSAAFLHFLLRCGRTLFIVSRVRGPDSGLHEGSNEKMIEEGDERDGKADEQV
jgi:hypothetical protein